MNEEKRGEFFRGNGVFGAAGPEAIMPLSRDKGESEAEALLKSLFRYMESIASIYGVGLQEPEGLLPLAIQMNAKSEYAHGVMSCLANLYYQICKSAKGRQTLLDLGLKPLLEEAIRNA
jgi:hypothetical protein